ncbi:serine protease [Nitrospinae bacterium AH_259_B05_G02_I21]|nr:serine protease [Nitrospinae bacterium AH_259_B05_G02_I21]MDA2932072.1 serine protease [Nitrospinae bacterium AH-259-F20]
MVEPTLQIDYRLGGKPQYSIGLKPGELMQVPPEIKKSVAFVCCNTKDGMRLAGTAFFVHLPVGGDIGGVFVYLVTAKHIIDKIKETSIDQLVYIRVNLKDRAADFIKVPMADLKFHPEDASVDVAVIQMPTFGDLVDIRTVPLDLMVATDEVIAEEGIDIGDEVFLVGLFSEHYGSRRNIPILRVGNIAQMPEEPIMTSMGLMEAYLIEARSIGGISGSPVFVHLGGIRTTFKGEAQSSKFDYAYYLLGLMHGHWDLPAPDADMLVEDILTDERINMGIAIVVPIQKILEVINQEELVERRDRAREEQQQNRLPTPDEAPTELTEEGFKEALKKASRPEEAQSDEGKTET